MTIAENRVRALPAVGSGRADQVPRPSEVNEDSVTTYVVPPFAGSTYVVGPQENIEDEPAESRLSALLDAVEALAGERDEYPDTPEVSPPQTELTRSLYQLQVEAIANSDADGG